MEKIKPALFRSRHLDRKLKILLIDDKPEDVRNIREKLSEIVDIHFEFDWVHSLSEGLFRIADSKVDIVLLDLFLTDSHGIHTFQMLHMKEPSVPVVVLSSFYDDQLAKEAMRLGAEDFLFKDSLDSRHLARTIRYAVERHHLKQELDLLTNELVESNMRLEKLAHLDSLTDLLNRRGIQEVLSREIRLASREDGSDLLALLIDIDDFKWINETLGHGVGDVVLKDIAAKLRSSLRLSDYVARVGVDMFLVLMPGTRLAEGARVAEKLRLALSGSPFSLSRVESAKVTTSVGLAVVSESITTVDELLTRNYHLLSQNRQNGKNKMVMELPLGEVSAGTTRQDTLQKALDELRRGSKFRVVHQPIVDLLEKRQVAAELLSRSEIEVFQMPDDFFKLCMENNILTFVDHECFKNCLKKELTLPSSVRRHVNIFPSTLIEVPVKHLLELFPKSREAGSHCVEISEQQIIGDPSYLLESVLAFKESGVLVAVDDVGFGRSCLESLVLLEPDIVKIDKKFVNGISKSKPRERSLKRLLHVANALNCEVIAEGIETESDLAILLDLGIRYGQGYLLGRPTA